MIRVRQIKVEVTKNDTLKEEIAKKMHIPISDILHYSIQKQSLDARKKEEIYYVYEVNVEIVNEKKYLLKNKNKDIFVSPDTTYQVPKKGTIPLKNRPIIIGSGPAGLFAAYILAEQNYQPIIIERGEKVEIRKKTVETFWKTGKLNQNSNVQFGEGGAGTFSDGKLNTLVKDQFNRNKKVLETFVKYGALSEILYSYRPHIGTDLLQNVIKNMREGIIKMGGKFLYNNCLTDIEIKNHTITRIEINHQEKIDTNILVLAIGHSARDTFHMLFQKNIQMEAKPFAIGIRVQHPQKMIDESQYGKKYAEILSKANYKLTFKSSNGRGVYSFCMCPGGYVVNASSEEKRIAINGMSNHERNTENANSAIVVTVTPKDFGTHPLDGMKYQRALEEKAYTYGNGNIPVQLLKDFYSKNVSSHFENIHPILKGDYVFADLNQILPKEIADSIKEAFPFFDNKIKGFNRDDTILAALESRTSSPVRINRDEFLESNIKGIYPCGEGAGYAGGITSAAIDGIKIAEAIIQKYQSF
jgi:uncharacterized FAD-dependent dehydrogenase